MKNKLLFLLFSLSSLTTFAQTQKIETRHFGILDTIFYVQKNDTFLIEKYYKNGHVESKKWKKDSIYEYYSDGNIHTIKSGFFQPDFGYRFRNSEAPNSNNRETVYYPNGSIFQSKYWESKDIYHEKSLKANGELVIDETFFRLNPKQGVCHQFYHCKWADGSKLDANFADTLTKLEVDSTFFPSGSLKRIGVYRFENEKWLLIQNTRFDSSGRVKVNWQLDSSRLHPDKDNSDCSFGFRNMKGDWVITPQYDNVGYLSDTYFVVNKNDKYGIVDDFGKTILPLEYGFISRVQEDFPYFLNSFEDEELHFLKFRQSNKYGIIDLKGKILVPPQYDNIGDFDGKNLAVKIGNKWGVADVNGRMIVPAKYYEIKFTESAKYFRGLDNPKNEKDTENNRFWCLINDQGKELLDAKFDFIKSIDSNILGA